MEGAGGEGGGGRAPMQPAENPEIEATKYIFSGPELRPLEARSTIGSTE